MMPFRKYDGYLGKFRVYETGKQSRPQNDDLWEESGQMNLFFFLLMKHEGNNDGLMDLIIERQKFWNN